jgi:serine/threonine protein kinase
MRPGTVVADRFELDGLAGAGGMAAVYRARDRTSGQLVACKIVRTHGADHVARFEREAQLLAELSHPHIVRYVAHGRTADGALFLAMEWLHGEDLATRLARPAPLAVAESVALARRVADALAVVHARGAVHRDVKPGNIFLPDGDPAAAKLLDFGVARVRARAPP